MFIKAKFLKNLIFGLDKIRYLIIVYIWKNKNIRSLKNKEGKFAQDTLEQGDCWLRY